MDLELDITLDEGRNLKIDLFWLRDHCRCENCYDHSNHQRRLNVLDIPDDISVASHMIDNEKLVVICKFYDFLIATFLKDF